MMNTWTVSVCGLVAAVISYGAMAHKKWLALASREKHQRRLRPVVTVKVIVRRDGRERVRIFRRSGGAYGVVVERLGPSGDWVPPESWDTGECFASPTLALHEASASRPWCLAEEINLPLPGKLHAGRLTG